MTKAYRFRGAAVVTLAASTLLLAGCRPQAPDTGWTNTTPAADANISAKTSPTASPRVTPTPSAVVPLTIQFVDYENRAVGYRIQRPDKWYWQHLIRSEIGEQNPVVDDYFITDRNPLPQLGSEYLGMIVIEVSRRDPADIAPSLEGFEKTTARVGDESATRFEGVRDNQLITNQKWIEYHFTRDNRLFRFMYAQSDATPADIAVFEEVVKSFTFNP